MEFPELDPNFVDEQLKRIREQGDKVVENPGIRDPRAAKRLEAIIKAEAEPQATLEEDKALIRQKYPRIGGWIDNEWGQYLLHLKLVKLTHMDTHGREGFPAEVGFALIRIHNAHMTEFPFETGADAKPVLDNKDKW